MTVINGTRRKATKPERKAFNGRYVFGFLWPHKEIRVFFFSDFLVQYGREHAAGIGSEVKTVGVKSIMLPGDKAG